MMGLLRSIFSARHPGPVGCSDASPEEAMERTRSNIAAAKDVIENYRTHSGSSIKSVLAQSDPSNIYGRRVQTDWTALGLSAVTKIPRTIAGDDAPDSDFVSYIVRVPRDTVVPIHRHPEIERIHVISGSIINLVTKERISSHSDRVFFFPENKAHGFFVCEDSVIVVSYFPNE